MQNRYNGCALFFIINFSIDNLVAQEPPAPKQNPKIVRIRFGSYSGMCFGYCSDETIIEPYSIRSTSKSWSDKWKYPDKHKERKIRREDWEYLEHSIDSAILDSLVGVIGCPDCADGGASYFGVQFSEGTEKFVAFEAEIPAIEKFLHKIEAIQSKPLRKCQKDCRKKHGHQPQTCYDYCYRTLCDSAHQPPLLSHAL
jgi:hypothetical protein